MLKVAEEMLKLENPGNLSCLLGRKKCSGETKKLAVNYHVADVGLNFGGISSSNIERRPIQLCILKANMQYV